MVCPLGLTYPAFDWLLVFPTPLRGLRTICSSLIPVLIACLWFACDLLSSQMFCTNTLSSWFAWVYRSWQADVGCRWNCPFPLPLTVASMTCVLVRRLMPARVVTGLAVMIKSMIVCAGLVTWSCLPVFRRIVQMARAAVALTVILFPASFCLNGGRSAVRLGLWHWRFLFACSFGSLLGRRPPVSSHL